MVSKSRNFLDPIVRAQIKYILKRSTVTILLRGVYLCDNRNE